MLILIQVNIPVKLRTNDQDVTINPGDYIIGDLNGVVCLPRGLAERAVTLLAPQAEADRLIAQDVEDGLKFTDATKKRRAALPKP
jgi:regulator of RNase E activity RraA